jgi:hypothetical protein
MGYLLRQFLVQATWITDANHEPILLPGVNYPGHESDRSESHT